MHILPRIGHTRTIREMCPCRYVIADAFQSGLRVGGNDGTGDASSRAWMAKADAVADTLLWQGLASVAIPGFTINRARDTNVEVGANLSLFASSLTFVPSDPIVVCAS
jgi:hypothetical protein